MGAFRGVFIMEKPIKSKIQWHIIVVVAIVFLLSIVSWLQFARSIGSSIIHHSSDNKVIETISDTTNNNTVTDSALPSQHQAQYRMLYDTSRSIDTTIEEVDSMWSIYKKSFFSKIDTLVTYFGIGEISSVQVLAGSNKWLFYKSRTDGNSIADFEGTNRYSTQEMERIAQSALLTQNGLENKGIRFAIVVAPNKENIYWEYMPDIYVHAEESSTDILIEFLRQKGVNVVSPKRELIENHLTSQLYYSYDTHWNQLGAYIGVRNTLASWNISMPELSNRNTLSRALNGYYHYHGEDDLAKMIGLRSVFSDEKEYEVDGTVQMDWTTYEEEQTSNKISHFYNENAIKNSRVFLIGDSFRSSMVPALREQFVDVYVVHRSYYTTKMLDEIHPDYLIAEYVERYSSEIGEIASLLK